MNKVLPYTSENHEFEISWDGATANINLTAENELEALYNPVTKEEFEDIIETAAIKGIKKINYLCDYSTEVKHWQFKRIGKKFNVEIERVIR